MRKWIQRWLGIDEVRENQAKILAALITTTTHTATILSTLGETPEEYRTPDRHIDRGNRYGL